MSAVKQTVLKFVLKTTGNPMEVMARFHPKGQTVLNSKEWRGKEPRSCGVTRVKGRPHSIGSESLVFDIEVNYRPKGAITFVGDTRYDGWTAMILDRMNDGTLLDGNGKPLPEGHPPVYLPFELHPDVDYNAIDFGEFVGETEVKAIRRVQFAEVMRQMQESGYFNASISSSFMAPRTHRPLVKIVLTNSPSSTSSDGFGTRIVNIDMATPQLQQVVVDQLKELLSGFLEGRYSIPNISSHDFVVAELSELLVDCTPNEQGQESRFHCLAEFVPSTFLEDLAKWVMANYKLDVGIVEGERSGLLLRRLLEN